MKLQAETGHIYVTLWDKEFKRPRRFYLGKGEEKDKWEELLKVAREYKVDQDSVRDFLDLYLDPERNLTKSEYVLVSLIIGEIFGRRNEVREGVQEGYKVSK